jgi:hypothetical protein
VLLRCPYYHCQLVAASCRGMVVLAGHVLPVRLASKFNFSLLVVVGDPISACGVGTVLNNHGNCMDPCRGPFSGREGYFLLTLLTSTY